MIQFDATEIEKNLFTHQAAEVEARAFTNILERFAGRGACVPTGHGRTIALGQVWRHNDPRRLRAVRIVDVDEGLLVAFGKNIVTGKITKIPFRQFTVGREGWSLERM